MRSRFGRKGTRTREIPVRGIESFGTKAGRRRVSVDANVLLAAIAYRSKAMPPVLDKIKDKDELIVSNIILMQCTRHAGRKKCSLSADEIRQEVLRICPDVVEIAVVPLAKLKEKYYVRDESDLETLYSVDETRSDIFITGDTDFYDESDPPRGVKVRFMRPREYLDEDD